MQLWGGSGSPSRHTQNSVLGSSAELKCAGSSVASGSLRPHGLEPSGKVKMGVSFRKVEDEHLQ